MTLVSAAEAATAGGALLVLAIIVPVVGALTAFICGGRWTERIALASMLIGLAIVIAILLAPSGAVHRSSICSAPGRRRSA